MSDKPGAIGHGSIQQFAGLFPKEDTEPDELIEETEGADTE